MASDSSLIHKFLSPFREFGLAAGFLYLVSRVLARSSDSTHLFLYELMVQPIPAEPIAAARKVQAFDSRWIKRGDPELAAMPIPAPVIESRFAQGGVCLGTFLRERFVGYIWFRFGPYDEDEVRCRYEIIPEPESVFDFDLYILPEFRLGRAFVALWQNASTLLRERGIKYSFSRVTRFNLASRRAHSHLGWKRAASALFIKLWRVEIMIASTFPYFSVSAAGRPSLVLRADVLGAPGAPTPSARLAADGSGSQAGSR